MKPTEVIGPNGVLTEKFKARLAACQTVADVANLIGAVHWFGQKTLFTSLADMASNNNHPERWKL